METDPIIGRSVKICSTGGIVYRGIVKAIRSDAEFGELFELCSAQNSEDRRLVYIVDRQAQIRKVDRET